MFLTASSAFAIGTLNRQETEGYRVTALHQTNSYLHIEWKTGATIEKQVDCYFSCQNVTPPASFDTVGYVLHLDDQRERIVAENCTGEDLGPGRCANGDYTVTLGLNVGELNFLLQGNDGLVVNFTVVNTRYWFGADKYWERSPTNYTHLPVGTYEAEFRGGTYISNCNPVISAPRFAAEVVEDGDSPLHVFTFDGTTCPYEFDNSYGQDVLISSSVGNCTAAAGSSCVIDVPWRADVTFTAQAPSGYTARFSHGKPPCAFTSGPDRSTCREDKAQQDFIDSAAIDLEVINNATAKGLVASVGSAPPADRVAQKGDANVVVAHMHVEPQNGTSTMGTVSVRVTGTAAPTTDLPHVRIFDDANNDGQVSAGEEQLAEQTFPANGVAALAVNEQIAAGRNFVVTVDVASELAAGASLPGAPWSLLIVAAIPVAVLYRRRRVAVGLAAALLVVGALYACGSGGGGDQDTDDDQQSSDNDNGGDNGGSDFDPPAGNVSFEFTVTGFTADSSTLVTGVPVDGATISVAR